MSTETMETVPFLSRLEVERRAREVLRRHGLMSIPIDPVVLANRLGISVNNAKFSDENIVGMIAKRGDKLTLLVNQADPPYRKRFTIAHELGHQNPGQHVRGRTADAGGRCSRALEGTTVR